MTKIRDTEPQKTRENSFQQLRNLEGAFQIDRRRVLAGPVLLVDYMVDSRWTLSIVGTKLRQSGAGPVFPFALSDASIKNGD